MNPVGLRRNFACQLNMRQIKPTMKRIILCSQAACKGSSPIVGVLTLKMDTNRRMN